MRLVFITYIAICVVVNLIFSFYLYTPLHQYYEKVAKYQGRMDELYATDIVGDSNMNAFESEVYWDLITGRYQLHKDTQDRKSVV